MNTDVAVVSSMDDVVERLASMGDGRAHIVSTITGADHESRLRVLDAVTNAEPLNEHIDEVINLKNWVMQATTMIDDETGEERPIIRTILMDADGTAYSAASDGIFKALQNMVGVLGQPSEWPDAGVPVKVVEVRSRRGFRFMSLRVSDQPRTPAKS